MFYKKNEDDFKSPVEGVKVKTLVHGKNTQLLEVRLKPGKGLPPHQHDYEQTGYLAKGHIVLVIGDEIFEARQGDSWNVPANVLHGCKEIIEEAIAVEIYSPAQI